MENKDKVSNHNPSYDALESKRVIIADVRGGTLALRDKAKTYLPKYDAELEKTYQSRLQTATFFNLYDKTENVMTGLVFQDEVDVSKVTIETSLLENIDNAGNSFNVVARKAFEKSFDGAAVILVDAPAVGNLESLEDEQKLGVRPYWVIYEQSCVINWRYRINPISRAKELQMLVVREETNEAQGRFSFEKVVRYRHWFVDASGKVNWEVWREVKKEDGKMDVQMEAFGQVDKLSALPIAVVGDLCASPPFLDIALLNIKLYQKESNFDMHEWQAAVNLFYTKGYDEEGSLPVASDFHYKLPEGGDIGWAQIDASGNDTMRESLKYLTEQISMLGLSQLADKTATVDLTATEALLQNIGETAELRVMAEQLKDALELALGFTAEYSGKGKDGGGEITLGAAWNKEPEVKAVPITGAPKAEQPKEMVM